MPTNCKIALTIYIICAHKNYSFAWFAWSTLSFVRFSELSLFTSSFLVVVIVSGQTPPTEFNILYKFVRPLYWIRLSATHSAPSMQINEQFCPMNVGILCGHFVISICFIVNTLLVTLEIISIIKRFRRSWKTDFIGWITESLLLSISHS